VQYLLIVRVGWLTIACCLPVVLDTLRLLILLDAFLLFEFVKMLRFGSDTSFFFAEDPFEVVVAVPVFRPVIEIK